MSQDQKLTTKQNVWQVIKFALFSISAAVIQFGISTLFEYVILTSMRDVQILLFGMVEISKREFIATTIGLACSVLWNFTFNRKFTFKAANNVPKAMFLAFLFYVPFYPFQIIYTDKVTKALVPPLGDGAYLVALVTCMLINFVLEFCWQRFVVFRNKINTNDIAQREKEKEERK